MARPGMKTCRGTNDRGWGIGRVGLQRSQQHGMKDGQLFADGGETCRFHLGERAAVIGYGVSKKLAASAVISEGEERAAGGRCDKGVVVFVGADFS